MKNIILLVIALVVALLPVSCGFAGSPMLDDTYAKSIYVAGNLTYNDPYYEEIVTPANAVGEGWPAPTASNAQSGFVYLFADEPLVINEKYVHFTIQMPHSYKESSNVTVNVRWIFNSDQVGTTVRWRMSYSWANIGDPFPVASNLWTLSAPSNNDSLIHQKTDFAAMNGTGKKIGSVLMCFLSRNSSDVSDNYTDTAIFVSANVLYQLDTPGSKSKFVK